MFLSIVWKCGSAFAPVPSQRARRESPLRLLLDEGWMFGTKILFFLFLVLAVLSLRHPSQRPLVTDRPAETLA